ncbi:hypothetical protein, partial [Microbacterium foliorum]|uniref:hypothetical protein n=1 Tax=Microbacterium foliorum TaxID=104336 RepID=UPI001E65CF46
MTVFGLIREDAVLFRGLGLLDGFDDDSTRALLADPLDCVGEVDGVGLSRLGELCDQLGIVLKFQERCGLIAGRRGRARRLRGWGSG